MIAFRDFAPEDTTRFLALSRSRDSLSDVVDRANQWIESEGADVVSVETILMPGVKSSEDTERGVLSDQSLEAALSKGSVKWLQVVRVWYRH